MEEICVERLNLKYYKVIDAGFKTRNGFDWMNFLRGEWVSEQDCETSRDACGKGLHVWKNHPDYSVVGYLPDHTFEVEIGKTLGEDAKKLRTNTVKMIRLVSDAEIFMPKVDLQRAKLSRANLCAANLSRANLSDAYLSGANLSRANLSRANLSGANLSGAYLSAVNLSRAYLPRANLSGAYLSWANLSGASLSCAYLSGANLSGADLSGANLSGADLSKADFSGAHAVKYLGDVAREAHC